MTSTVDPHTLAREGLVFLEPDGPLARWVAQTERLKLELDRSISDVPDGDEYMAAKIECGLESLNSVQGLLCDLVTAGEYLTEDGAREYEAFVEVFVR